MAEKSSKTKAAASKKNDNKVVDKKTALENALKQIDKQFGAGTLMRLGEQERLDIEAIPTGSIALDTALGIGGIPKGRVTEIYGPESSGKTTVALHIVAECQKTGGVAAFIDAEHALDPIYAKKIGVDIDNLLVSQPDNGEQALEICDALVRSAAVDIIVVDSVAALTPRAEIDGDMGDTHVGLLARLMSQALRKLTGNLSKNNTTMIFINQVREKIGITYGNPEVTTGGRALKFYSSVRMEVRKGEAIKQSDDIIGSRTKVKIAKNKVAPPFKIVEFDIMYGEGISKEGNIIDVAVELEIVQKSGSWYSYNGERMGQGRENAKNFLKTHEDICTEIENKIREHAAEASKIIGVKEDDAKENTEDSSEETDSIESEALFLNDEELEMDDLFMSEDDE